LAKAKWAAVAAGAWLIIAPTRAAEDPAEFFEMKVRPLLARNCYACHTTSPMSGLHLDSRENILKGGSRGPAVVPGNPEESLLIQATSYSHEKLRMPPSGRLKAEEIEILKTWIKDGAVWPADPSVKPVRKSEPYVITAEQRKFWSFQPVSKPIVPEVKNQNWPRSAIDRFVLASLEKSGIKSVEPADKRILIRRATFDLIGLPPSPEEVDAFLSDTSPNAFARVVDRLLASPHYGERWARYWLDLARYSDGKLGATRDDPYPNAFRYRDWVIEAFNQDLPYDLFLKAQIAADVLENPDRDRLLPALGFQALGPRVVAGVAADDRVDVVGRSMLGLTTGCAQCHDHKYDPIPTSDYYSLLGVFKGTDDIELPLAPADQVDAYKSHRKQMDDLQASIDDYIEKQNQQLMEIFFSQISSYMMASWTVLNGEKPDLAAVAAEQKLDRETLRRWVEYLRRPEKEHQYLREWYEVTGKNAPRDRIRAVAEEFQRAASAIYKEKQAIDDRNYVKLGGAEGSRKSQTRTDTQIEFLTADKGYLMSDLTAPPYMNIGDGIEYPQGIFYYGAKRLPSERGVDLPPARLIDRFLYKEWRDYLESMRNRLAVLRNKMPPPYPFLHAVGESKNPVNLRVAIRGDAANLGDEAPRRFLQILCDGECKPFMQGSGRRELAAAIADPRNPLTARVLVNRLWAYHFGHGIVRTTSNFGRLGERPTHPELLDYLASRFIEDGWSIKKIHREMMLSAVYSLSSRQSPEGNEKDPENRLLWRANIVQRLDVEALRDSLLAVAGNLERSMGGPPMSLSDEKNNRRTIYGTVGRSSLNVTLSLFDFPDANSLSEERVITAGPLQRLFFLNSDFVARQAEALAGRVAREAGEDDRARIERAYRLLYGRPATDAEIRLGLDFLKESGRSWPQYAQVLLSSTEFFSVN
jgi:hypothetical protein